MNAKLRRKARQRKQKMLRRIEPAHSTGASPMIKPDAIKYELADKQQAIAAGGIGTLLELAKRLDLRKEINQAIPLFKLYLPYDEADHIFNIAMNLLAGGHCREHIEDRRCDEAYLNALDAQRIPDPTTSGDFCRRFSTVNILQLMDAYYHVRVKVWNLLDPFDLFLMGVVGSQSKLMTFVSKILKVEFGVFSNREPSLRELK